MGGSMDPNTTTSQPVEASAAEAQPSAEPQSAMGWAPTERISWFPIPDEADLDPRVADLVRRQREKLGAPNNVVRVHAWRPELMLRWLEFYAYITKVPSSLSRAEREMIGVVLSAEHHCIISRTYPAAESRTPTGAPAMPR